MKVDGSLSPIQDSVNWECFKSVYSLSSSSGRCFSVAHRARPSIWLADDCVIITVHQSD